MGDDLAEILFQSFPQETLVSGSGIGRDVKEFSQFKKKQKKTVFTCWTGAYCLVFVNRAVMSQHKLCTE